jgi:hypothetical protein
LRASVGSAGPAVNVELDDMQPVRTIETSSITPWRQHTRFMDDLRVRLGKASIEPAFISVCIAVVNDSLSAVSSGLPASISLP